MATFVSCYISDLSPVKDSIKLCMRILCAWLQPLYNNQQVQNIEMIVMDEHVYVVGQVIACEDLNNYDKNGKSGKKPVTLIDDEACHGKVIKSTDYIDHESEMPKKPDGPHNWWMRLGQCRCCFLVMRFRLWLIALLIDYVYAKIESDGSIPTEITNLIGNEYAFKFAIDDYNVKKLLHDNEATSNTVLAITLLDLESQTDKNTTPNEKQKTNKRPAEGELGSECSTGKKNVVEIKVKKDA
nr:hypothetical protein [Tanacetum cinerariifolium]